MTDPGPGEDLGEAVRGACVLAALRAYEDAGMQGLCLEGRWEAAVSAMRDLDLGGGTRDRIRRGDRLPRIGLRDPFGEVEVDVRPTRGPRVVVTLHRGDCDACIGYVEEIASTDEPLEAWGADILAISPDPLSTRDTVLARLGIPVLEDPEHVLADGRVNVLIADEWGEVHFAGEPSGMHSRVAPEDVLEWVKFIAIQCPECEGPEGEWRNL